MTTTIQAVSKEQADLAFERVAEALDGVPGVNLLRGTRKIVVQGQIIVFRVQGER